MTYDRCYGARPSMDSIRRSVLMFVVSASVFAVAGCGFLGSQTKANVAATCQRSCASVPADTQSDCQTRCQNR